MPIDAALSTFITEAREMLDDMERALLNCRRGDAQAGTVDAIFRAAHTIKGSAGLFGLDHVVAFTHVVESALDAVRAGAIVLDEPLIGLLLRCGDHIGVMIEAIADGHGNTNPAIVALTTPLLHQLGQHMPAPAAAAAPAAGAPELADEDVCWHISLRFGREVMRYGMDPTTFLRSLAALGRVAAILTLYDDMPPTADMDAEQCYLGFEITFATKAGRAAIEDVFEFVADDCAIRVVPPHSPIGDYLRLLADLPDAAPEIRAMLLRAGSVNARELDAALSIRQELAPLAPPCPPAPAPDTAIVEPNPAAVGTDVRPRDSRTIRVDAAKLDHLITLVGELIIAGARTELIARRSNDAEQQESTSILSGLVEDIRDSALQLRMVKIGATFNRFQRVVHDVAREIGKDIALTVDGEDTELDKTIVEQIGDPLTHLIRNAIDHGIEPAQDRVAAGKPAVGHVRLNAYHDSGAIVIEVSDDGAGLNREKILAKALERKLIEPEQKLSDAEVFNLVFEPGFSTAEQITSLSGRGVGMDVVKRNITALRGSVAIASILGLGTTITVRLPLTLAIIDGFMVSLGRSLFVIPLDMIEECIEYSSEAGLDYTNLRGQVLPFLRLHALFADSCPRGQRESIVVVKHGHQRAGLVVDGLLGEFQTVIRPLNSILSGLDCVSGSTILGSGEVALILDVPALLRRIGRQEAVMA